MPGKRLLFIFGLCTLFTPEIYALCPEKCLCVSTTVRCMFVHLEQIPLIPEDTTVLDLRFNKIKDISRNKFKHLKNLNTLFLNNNHITRIEDEAFNGLEELRYLYLYKNRIKTIGSQAFKSLRKLQQLYMHFNKIEKIEPNTFADLPSLERLFLHNNKLSRIPYGAFKKIDSLRRLRLDSNALVCDCELMWLSEMLKENKASTQAAAICEQPNSLKGKPLTLLNNEDFRCKRPKLTEEPNDIDVSFGGVAYFNCKADGDPKPDIVWLHNSNEILPEQDDRYSVLTDGTLMITKTQDLDAGVYECMAKNPAGEIKSRAAKMHYLNTQENRIEDVFAFAEKPVDDTVTAGSTIVLPCKVISDRPPRIEWTQNGAPLPKLFRYHVSSNGNLTIKNIQTSDAGTYQCIATNRVTSISASARIVVEAPPVFLERPRDQEAIEGNNVELMCEVDGYPTPVLSWSKEEEPLRSSGRLSILKNGSVLSIEKVIKQDEGTYVCHAHNRAGQRHATGLLVIREKVPPVFSRVPEDKWIEANSSVELPCHANGQPMPLIRWHKDGVPLNAETGHHLINMHGNLYMFNIRKRDAGIYECIAENDVGTARVSMRLTVVDGPIIGRPGDRYVVTALHEAQREIDNALNHTLTELFDTPHQRSPIELFQAFRFPTNEARLAARAAEIYERTLELVWEHVRSGASFNLSEFRYADILSASKMELLANLSGCHIHRQNPVCIDVCFHRSYRTFDGTCNNFNNPRWGSSLTPFRRLLPPVYENGFNTPIGWSPTRLYHGYSLPSARLVSTSIVSADRVTQDTQFTHMLMQWGQFLDHDLDFSMPAISKARYVDGVDCTTSCEYATPCFPIEVPPEDRRIRRHRCMEFVRSSTVCGSGFTSVFFNTVQPREQANQLTAYLDASNVYGSNERIAQHLRELSSNRGLMRTGVLMHTGKPLLPFNDGQPIDCKRDLAESSIDCFLTGDVRGNEQLGLLSMHTLWVREHNRIARKLFTHNPHWDNDKLYHEARKIVGAIMQHITYSHWLPKILGRAFEQIGPYKGYDPDANPSIANVFATAALRFGHTLINPELMRLNESFQPIPEGNIPLRKAFFAPFRLLEEGGIDPLMRGLIYASAKLKQPDQLLNSDLTEHLFTPAHLVAQDLAALNIQRGRDHALPTYNHWRRLCNLTVARTFDDFRNEIRDGHLLTKLERLYGHPDNVDLWVGGISEDPYGEAKVGPTFLCLLIEQFKRIREGDRFWYENPGVFTSEQLIQIRQSSLGRVICDNGDNITRATRDVFVVPHLQSPSFVECSSIPKVELGVWTECCQECNAIQGRNDINRIVRSRRSAIEIEPVTTPRVVSNTSASGISQLWKDSDFDITEQRIEGIEDLVGKLQKTVQKLSRKVRRLENEFKQRNDGSCTDALHKTRQSGEFWKQDKCTKCHCENSQITCWVETCQPSHCINPRFIEGECCPVC